MWFTPMLRVEMCSTPVSFNARSIDAEISDLCPTLMHRLPGTEIDVGLRHGVARDRGHDPEPRAELVEQIRLVLLAAVDGDSELRSPLHPRIVRGVGVHGRATVIAGFGAQFVVPGFVAVDLAQPVLGAVFGQPRRGIDGPDVDRVPRHVSRRVGGGHPSGSFLV